MIDTQIKEIAQPQAEQKESVFRKAWNKWMRFAEIIGTVQMVIILTIMYWVLLSVMAIPFKIFSDPLSLRRSHKVGWVERPPGDSDLNAMKNQF